MAYLRSGMRGILWVLYRVFGLACIGLAAQMGLLIAQFESSYVPRAEQWPYVIAFLLLLCGGLVLLPSTTPVWIKQVRSPASAGLAITSLVALWAAVLAGVNMLVAAGVLVLASLDISRLLQGVSVLVLTGVLCAGGLGLISPGKVSRRVPIMDAAAARRGKLHPLPNASRYR